MITLPKKITDVKETTFVLNLTTGIASRFLSCGRDIIPCEAGFRSFDWTKLFYTIADAPGKPYRYNSWGIAYDSRKAPLKNILVKKYPWINPVGEHTFNIRVLFAVHLYTNPSGEVVAKNYVAYLTREFIPGAIPADKGVEWIA
ncbi:unnamed protein product, partial [marine sediment metagenome]